MWEGLIKVLGIDQSHIVSAVVKILIYTVSLPLVIFMVKRAYDDSIKRRERRRKVYAEALAACLDYIEYVFVIYRRGKKDPEAERQRISTGLMDVQKRVAYHRSWLVTESPKISKAYDKLVNRMKQIAGQQMKRAWATAPITKDKDMTIKPYIDWQDFDSYKDNYVRAVRSALAPWWNVRRKYFVHLK